MKRTLTLLLALAMIFSLIGCSSTSGSSNTTTATASETVKADDTVYNVSIGHGTAEDTAQHQCALAIKDYLETNGDGHFKVTIYPNSQLGANREMTESVLEGNLTMMLTSSGTQTSFVSSSAIFDVPFAWKDETAMEKTIFDTDFLAALDADHQAAGFKLIMLTHSSFRQLSANKEIRTLDDLKGFTIRTQENQFQMATWKALGANPTPLAFNELYTALQQGTVDGQDNPLELFTSQKFYEQQKYLMKINYLGYVGMWICNLDFYNSLPDDLRAIFDEAMLVGRDRNQEYSKTSNTEKEKMLTEQYDVTIVDLSEAELKPFKDATAGVWDQIEGAVSKDVWDSFKNTVG
ncbi:MAG: TRAP transporter substrate-binding protein [Oscillospiraceae bacterium]